MKNFSDTMYVADFETTVEENPGEQTETEVWSAAICPIVERPEPKDVTVYNNIDEFIEHLKKLADGTIVFFHNAKFDLSFLIGELHKLGFNRAMSFKKMGHYASDEEMECMTNCYTACISNMGQWYYVRIRFENKTIEIRDSLKKLPFDLRTIGKSFKTKYQKLEMQYENDENIVHKAYGKISDEEMKYIINDVLVLSEAMYIIWYKYEMKGITIGSDCLAEYKKIMDKKYKSYFPDMTKIQLPNGMNGYEYCVKAYSGGWCWKNPVSDNKVYMSDIKYSPELTEKFNRLYRKIEHVQKVKNIVVVDVNSLYPSVMSSESKSYYPVGKPTYKTGQPKASEEKKYAIIRRFKCRFEIKPGYLPFMHIRDNSAYDANECLTTSDIDNGRYYTSRDGVSHDTLKEYTMTQPEWELFCKHYKLKNYEPIDYLLFKKEVGIFDEYIDKYRKMKIEASKSGDKAMRQISKLYLNNLYGKLSSSTNSSYKVIYFNDEVMKFKTYTEYDKDPVYIPAGAYVTAWARSFTITAGQKNYFEGQHKGVMYSDTDSLHLVDLNPDELIGIPFHATDFCKWACEESSCAAATYAKQKTYIEIATEEDFETVKDKEGNDSYNLIIKAAGLGKNGKDKFVSRLMSEENPLYLDDFKSGLKIANSNLKAKQIKGGIILVPSDFKLS